MNRFSSLADDFYISMNLTTEMELECSRETISHYFEQVQKKFPSMRNFYQRDKGEFALEEDKQSGRYRWCSIEPRRVGAWHFNPETMDEAMELHQFVLDLVPFALSIRPLDCETLNFMLGFDFTYRGNHNALISEALGVHPAFDSISTIPGIKTLSNEPSLTLRSTMNAGGSAASRLNPAPTPTRSARMSFRKTKLAST